MRISIVSHSYAVAENQKNIAALAQHVDLNALVPHRSGDKIFGTVWFDRSAARSGVYRVSRRLGLHGAQYLLLTSDLGFRSFRPDLIQVEYDPWSAIFWQSIGCRRAFAPGAKVVCLVKNNTYRRYPGASGGLKGRLARLGVQHVDQFIAASEAVARLYEEKFGVPGDRIRVMQHLGVDTTLFAPRPQQPGGEGVDGLRIGFCGRLDPVKGVNELFEAVRRARASDGLDLRLDFLGDGQLKDKFARLAREHDWFRLLPRVPHDRVPEFLATLDLFVLPTGASEALEEHDAHALLEAMAMGLPCVGTRSGITPEILEDETGLLVEPNSAEELRRGLLLMVRDTDRRNRFCHRARKKAVTSFSLEAVAAQRAQLYTEVVHA